MAQTWRTSIAYVLQEPFLFHDTIRANLLIAKPDADESELRQALASASAATFVILCPQVSRQLSAIEAPVFLAESDKD